MNELLKELCLMSGVISDLIKEEKNPMTKQSIMQLHVMVSEKIVSSGNNKVQGIENDYYRMVIGDIKKTGTLADGYKNKTNTYIELSGHVIYVINEVESLFLSENIKDEMLTVNQPLIQ